MKVLSPLIFQRHPSIVHPFNFFFKKPNMQAKTLNDGLGSQVPSMSFSYILFFYFIFLLFSILLS
jgi:hypothetical protein